MFDTLTDALVSFALRIIELFPESPLQPLIVSLQNSSVVQYLGYVNYFIPIGQMLGILSVWLTAIAAYYVYQIVMRWLKVIE